MKKINREIFYKDVRKDLFGDKLSQEQVSNMEIILNFWESPPAEPTGKFKSEWDKRCTEWLAYMLATTYHESARTMHPISEFGGAAYFTKRYENNAKIKKALGNTQKGDGAKFCGRGYVQLTGRANYTKMTPIVREFYPNCPDFTIEPEAAKKSEYAAVILFYGMFIGSFTGRGLDKYISDPEQGGNADFYQARRIINGLDKAGKIKSYAEEFNQALDLALGEDED